MVLLTVVGAGVVSSLATGAGWAGASVEPVPMRYMTVTGGQTLWAIAGELAPDVDRRDTVALIRELNAMPGSSIRAGQRLAVPAEH